MKVLDEGHKYELDNNKDPKAKKGTLVFFKDEKINGDGYPGTTNQEVLRALINRVQFLEGQVPSPNNERIVKHLRMALVLHETRHLERLVERGEAVELIEPYKTGHFV